MSSSGSSHIISSIYWLKELDLIDELQIHLRNLAIEGALAKRTQPAGTQPAGDAFRC